MNVVKALKFEMGAGVMETPDNPHRYGLLWGYRSPAAAIVEADMSGVQRRALETPPTRNS